MAKKWKKKIEDEKGEFKFPKFEEREFLVKELKETRILLINVLLGIIFAFISVAAMIYISKDFFLGLMFGIIGILSLRGVYPIFKVDIKEFDKKKWFMSGASFFGVWLAIWVLLVNPPISDFTPPAITEVKVGSSSKIVMNGDIYTYEIGNWTNLSVVAKITDNYQLNSGSVQVTISASGGQTPKWSLVKLDSNRYKCDITNLYPDQYQILISCKDTYGNQKSFNFTLVLQS